MSGAGSEHQIILPITELCRHSFLDTYYLCLIVSQYSRYFLKHVAEFLIKSIEYMNIWGKGQMWDDIPFHARMWGPKEDTFHIKTMDIEFLNVK